MTLDEFIDAYDGDYIEVGGSENAKFQCVDLVNAYIQEVLGKKPIFGADAKDFWTMADNSYQRISPVSYPIKGDIIIWKIGSAGHIAVAVGVTYNGKFRAFSQNYPLKSNSHLVDFTLKDLIGYLRPTNQEVEMGFSDEQIRKNVEAYVKKARKIWFGTEKDSQADIDFRFSEIQKGSEDTLGKQEEDYSKSDSLWILKSEAQKILKGEIDLATMNMIPISDSIEKQEQAVSLAIRGLIKPSECPKCPVLANSYDIRQLTFWQAIKYFITGKV